MAALLDQAANVSLPAAPRSFSAWLTKPRVLVGGFAGLHVLFLVALLPTILTGDVLGDLPLYRDWAIAGLDLGQWPGIATDWVYPVGALVPIVAAALAGPALYQLLWFLMTTALNAASVYMLATGAGRRGYRAAWWWMLVLLIMSPVALLRLEGITAPMAIIGLTLIARRPAVAAVILSAATWIKVWPAALILALVVACRRRWVILITGVAFTLGVVVLVYALGGIQFLTSFVATQSNRGLQLEAPITTPWLWMTVLGVPGTYIWQNLNLNTEEVSGPGDAIAAAVTDPAMLLAVALVLTLIFLALRRGTQETRLLLVGSLALVTTFVVFNKVGSPQYMLWFAPVVALGIREAWREWRTPAMLMLAIAGLTTAVFPILYLPLIAGNAAAAAILTTRNTFVIVLFCWAVGRLWSMARRVPGEGALQAGRRRDGEFGVASDLTGRSDQA
ncbi:MAG: hypothetical protein QOF36_1703 [Microbacteriaceae bacterium]|jgi:hypothetical protein|nr:hypothetical protein [Microbacteriaceae bacterium]